MCNIMGQALEKKYIERSDHIGGTAFCLRNIARNGKVYYMNSIIELPLLKDEKGVNEAGTFHLICRKCDGEIFQDYENPDNYEEIPTMKMLAEIHMKNSLKNISKRLIEIEMYGIMRNCLMWYRLRSRER